MAMELFLVNNFIRRLGHMARASPGLLLFSYNNYFCE
jgi:hypothetical protein